MKYRPTALLLVALAVPAAAAQQGSVAQTLFPKGEVVPKVTCAADAKQSYQLYLPSTYDPARRWPVVYALDARGIARNPMERFRPAAEKYGFIVVSSFNSASDGQMQVNFDAMRALWADTHARLSIDDRRVYLAGFSGTVRASCALAFLAPGTVAGVIGAAAGFPFKRPPDAKTDFLFFGTVGDKDFNYDEMIELEDKLTGLSLPHRIEEFVGVHEWMPEALATEALEWLELRAMKDGRRPRDPALLAALWARDLAAARALEAAGKPYFAWRRYRAMAADYAGLAPPGGPVDAAVATAKAAELGASPAVRDYDRERHAAAERDRAWVRTAQRTLAGTTETDDVALRRVLAALDIPRLKEAERKLAGTAEGLSAERRLNTIATQTASYLPREYIQRKEYARAAFFLAIASEIRPDDPFVHYSLAAMRSRLGDRRAALAELQARRRGRLPLPPAPRGRTGLRGPARGAGVPRGPGAGAQDRRRGGRLLSRSSGRPGRPSRTIGRLSASAPRSRQGLQSAADPERQGMPCRRPPGQPVLSGSLARAALRATNP